MDARYRLINWAIFISLSFIWGSSFILIKIGLQTLNAYQVAALRILSAGVILLPMAIRKLKHLPREKIPLIILSGLLGNFFPAFLFSIAETKIDSSLTGILNALTPFFTILTGIMFFKSAIQKRKVAGVIIGFIGLCLLFINRGIQLNSMAYSGLVLLATISYGVNVNMVSRYLRQVDSVTIASFAFSFLLIPSFLILFFTGFFSLPFDRRTYLISGLASFVLGVLGTALASIIFYMLVKRAGVVFTSMVTYCIPFIAILWGLLYNEGITLPEIACLGIILSGVFLTNK
jgi:drug/metabolite transporter (DMT)-like permease